MRPPNSIAFQIKLLANQMKRKLDDYALIEETEHLTGMQGWMIGYVHANANRPVYQRDLEHHFNIRRATVSGVLRLMESRGLIIRKSAEFDARLKEITLTPKALELLVHTAHRFHQFEHELRLGLSDEDITSFFAIAEKLKKNLE